VKEAEMIVEPDYEEAVKTLTCDKHGDYEGKTEKVKIGPTYMTFETKCPVCEMEDKEREAVAMAREERQRKVRKLKAMNIDERYYETTFDNFHAYNDELRLHLKTCHRFADHPDGKLVMLGKNGTGKTHLAISVLKLLGGVIYTAYEIGVNLRESYNGGGIKEHEVLDELCSVPLLVIDEIEKLKDSEAKQNWMSHVIGKRYNRMLPIIIIANCHLANDCAEGKRPCPGCLEHHLESDVISRITEDGIIMNFNSDDYREKIKEDRLGK
jgi:DNA replication protein DnaC